MKSHSFLCCGALLCNAAAAFFIPYVRSPSLVQGDTTALGPDGKPPSCLDDGNVTLYETFLPSKRSISGSCGSHRSLVDEAYKDCAARARAGERVARAKDSASSTLIREIFKDDSDQTRNHIAEHFALIAAECEKNGGGPTPVACGYCKPGVAGLTVLVSNNKDGSNEITLCDVALHPEKNSCDKQVLGDVLLHELSHSWGLTKDHGYGVKDIRRMSGVNSLNNADSYTVFAKSARLGCVVQGDRLVEGSSKDGKQGGVYNGNPSDEDNNNNNGNGDDEDKEKGKPKPSSSRHGGSGNTPTSSAKGPGGARPSPPSSPPHPTSKPSGGRQGGSGGIPTSSAKGPGRGQPPSPSSPPSPSGKSPGGGQDDSDDEGDEDGPCSYQNTNAPHSVSTVTSITVIRPSQSTVIVTVTRSPTSTLIVTVTKPREMHQTTTPTPSKSAGQTTPDQTLPEEPSQEDD
ncbi:hypothetical protein E4U17_004523 [Claviceps sp. LM77 group G4]|nr:hypothetical protein E4U17_004523 [Claviceps sp. LM77 group G4]KAG6078486.1 hypothetical protein E4U16_001621 [Claviceps sp. LM84 group G4]